MAALAQAGLNVPEGFIITQEALEQTLSGEAAGKLAQLGGEAKKADDKGRLELHREAVAVVADATLPWELEMELAKALDAMPEGAWLAPSQEGGGIPVFAPVRSKNALVERVKELWAAVLEPDAPENWHEPFSPVVAIKAIELEVSGLAEMSREGKGALDVEAIFGLPQALIDRKIMRDKYRYSTTEYRQLRASLARQSWQYQMSEKGVSKVEVTKALSGERKLPEESLAALAESVNRASETLEGTPAMVWGVFEDAPYILWVLDLLPYDVKPKKKQEPKAIAAVQGDATPVTATRIMASYSLGDQLPALQGVHGIFPLKIEQWLSANIAAHPLSEGGRTLDELSRKLAESLHAAAKATPHHQVVVSLSNLTSGDFRAMPGGDRFEPTEPNPAMGFRGGARHLSPGYDRLLDAELAAIASARMQGARNLSLALPFVRTTEELRLLVARAQRAGLERGHDFKIWMFVEVPSNVFLAEEYARLCDGLAIRLEPLYQLLSAVDPGSTYLADAGFARPSDEGARRAVAEVIRRARAEGKPTVLCGERLHEAHEVLQTAVNEGVEGAATSAEGMMHLARAVAGMEQRILLESAARLRTPEARKA